jgi:hypothetical protein
MQIQFIAALSWHIVAALKKRVAAGKKPGNVVSI